MNNLNRVVRRLTNTSPMMIALAKHLLANRFSVDQVVFYLNELNGAPAPGDDARDEILARAVEAVSSLDSEAFERATTELRDHYFWVEIERWARAKYPELAEDLIRAMKQAALSTQDVDEAKRWGDLWIGDELDRRAKAQAGPSAPKPKSP